MGGAIGVDSVEGQGSTFWFTARFSSASSGATTPLIRSRLQGRRALVVDSRPLSRQLLHGVLTAFGMQADLAGSGREAIDRVVQAPDATPYEVVITEMALPDMSGLDLIHTMRENRILRHHPTLSRIPLIALTSQDRRGQGEAAVHAGFAAYLTKPAKRSQIVDAIAGAILGLAAGDDVALVEEIPFAADEAQLATGPQASASAGEGRQSAPDRLDLVGGGSRRGTLVLVVEDNPNNQIMAMRQLEKLGCSVHILTNGLQAVKTLAHSSGRYDLVFMDCQMPEMDGFAATREIRKTEVTSGRHIPIVAMTANAMSGDRENCIAAGMDDYIAKPVSRHVLREVLERWLSTPEVSKSA
jgi:CheY-like chemotaxis protein